jgi:hypothetical protein
MNLTINTETVMASKERQTTILKVIKANQPISLAEIASKTGYNIKSITATVSKLAVSQKIVKEYSTKSRFLVRMWTTADNKKVSPTIKVEKFTPKGKFLGIRWNPSDNRPGCEDFLKCPSRVGDNLMPHRPMMHGAISSKGK